MAWKLMGACEGTFAPTTSPVAYAGKCQYSQCRMTIIKENCSSGSTGCSCTSCTGGDNNCSCAEGETSSCKLCEKDTKKIVCSLTDVDPWDNGEDYFGGDVVRVAMTRLKCPEDSV